MRTLIVDDQQVAIDNLQNDLQQHGQVEIVSTAKSVVEGIKAIQKHRPDLLFLDVQLGDGTGFDILDIIDHPVKVIFTTSSDEYAVRAFKVSAIDYLLKPIDPELLEAAIQKAATLGDAQIETMKNQLGQHNVERVILNTHDQLHIIHTKDLLRCEAQVNYTVFYLNDQKIMITKTLKEYDNLLSESGFIRVHQSHLVNLNQVKAFKKQDGGFLVMKDGSEVPVSSRKRQDVIEALQRLQ